MAMKKCRSRGGQISSRATKCPHCGERARSRVVEAIFYILTIAAVLTLFIVLGWNDS